MITTDLLNKLWNKTLKTHPIEYYNNLIPKSIDKAGIEKNIIQTTKDKQNIPIDIQKNIDFLKKNNPSWNYLLFDDKDIIEFIRTYYGDEVLKYYLRINTNYGAAKADLFRYLVLYIKGGVYIDIKSTIYKPLDETLKHNDTFLLDFWDNFTGYRASFEDNKAFDFSNLLNIGDIIYTQWIIISSSRNLILYNIISDVLQQIDLYNPYIYGVATEGTLRVTGPDIYSYSIFNTITKNKSIPYRYINYLEDIQAWYSIFYKKGIIGSNLKHATLLKSNYRDQYKPVIKCNNRIIGILQDPYLYFIKKRRDQLIRRQDRLNNKMKASAKRES